jgi:hypothetical protein
MTLKTFRTFVNEATLLNEIGDASARTYKTKYEIKELQTHGATFVVKNEDYDPNDPQKNWDDIKMALDTHITYEGIDRDQPYISVGFAGIRNGWHTPTFDTLDIGLKYLFRIMATVVAHVKNHIEDYEKARERNPKMKPLSGIYFDSSDKKRGGKTGLGKTQRDKLYKAYIEKSLRKIYPRAKVEDFKGKVVVHFNKDRR